jgi:hypothetical protein
MLNLTEKQVKDLEEFIKELPTKFGLPLLNLLNKFALENQPKAEEPKVPEAV